MKPLDAVRRACLATLFLLLTPLSHANIEFQGAGNFQIQGSEIAIEFDRLCNTRQSGRSGTLFVQLVASTDDDPAGPVSNLTEQISLGQLNANQCFTDITLNTAYQPPAEDTYFVFFVVFEFPELSTFLDSRAATGNPFTLGDTAPPPPGSGNVDGGSSAGDLSLEGAFRFQRNGNSVTIEGARISNSSSTRTTGTLFLSIVASTGDTPFGQNPILARASLALQFTNNGALPPNSSFNDIRLTTDFTEPPVGTYNLFLVLTEFPETNQVLDFAQFSEPFTVGAPPPPANAGSGGLPITVPSTTPGVIAVPGEADRYEIVLSQSGTLRAFSTGSTDTVATLSTADGAVLATSDDEGSALNFDLSALLQPGTYLLEIRGFGSATGAYDLVTEFSADGASSTPPPPPPPAPAGSIEIVGGASFARSGDVVTVRVSTIRNTSSTRRSGSLFLRLFATTGGIGDSGFTVANLPLSQQFIDAGTLPANSSFNDVDLTGDFIEPPPGSYNLFLVLTEFPNENTAVDSLLFSTPLTIDAPPPPPPPPPPPASTSGGSSASGGGGGSGAGGGGGGGGALDPMTVLLLAALLALHARRRRYNKGCSHAPGTGAFQSAAASA